MADLKNADHRDLKNADHRWEEIPDYGDLMTMEDFKSACESGAFIDYDGCGYYATETQMTRTRICPSNITQGEVLEGFTHVVWFNK